MAKRKLIRERGFTLIELLIVVAIIGILAAVAIPNLLAAMDRARQKRTMSDIRTIALSWEARSHDAGDFGSAGMSICCTNTVPVATLRDRLDPTYARPLPVKDGWGNQFEFGIDGTETSYLIWSYGKNGQKQTNPPGGATTKMTDDIIYMNGMFAQYPEGVQMQ
jgi:general secretion pathway protein G